MLTHLFNRAEVLCQRHYTAFCVVLLLINLLVAQFVIRQVPYTEIDWETYMIQVGLVRNGTLDYASISGPTGPLVYPAGHVVAYTALHQLTSGGVDIRLAQHIFSAFHTAAIGLALRLFRVADSLPLVLAPLLLLSRRALSLFVLRLFNDAVQTIFIYAFLLLSAANRWRAACLCFSLAVSIKMNALLYAPGLAVLLCQAVGAPAALRLALGVCLPPQLLLAAPFLRAAPRAYLARAFELTRVFLYKWSVNGAFLPEGVFTSSRLAVLLLSAHAAVLLGLAHTRWTSSGAGLWQLLLSPSAWQAKGHMRRLKPAHVVFVLASANFVGVAFARTLHYQFYLWYVHLLPVLIGRSRVPSLLRLASVLAIEAVFNLYPPSAPAASVLAIAHFIILIGLFSVPQVTESEIYEMDGNKTAKKVL